MMLKKSQLQGSSQVLNYSSQDEQMTDLIQESKAIDGSQVEQFEIPEGDEATVGASNHVMSDTMKQENQDQAAAEQRNDL